MAKGGQRKGAGNSSWNNRPTVPIRVPKDISQILLKIARILDNDESLDVAIESLKNFYLSFDKELLQNGNNEDESSTGNDMSPKINIEALYYITDIDNIPSILERGILSHSLIEKENIRHKTVYNAQVNSRRADKTVYENKTLWDYANLYFQPRNAMLYSIYSSSSNSLDRLAIICVNKKIFTRKGIFITTGNAASNDSEILPLDENKKLLLIIRDSTDTDWWNNNDGSKRKIMAECLVPNKVAPSYISHIYVASEKVKQTIELSIADCQRFLKNEIQIFVEPKRFFQPDLVKTLYKSYSKSLKIVKGDLFFSRAQTLTISVNCVGVMGAGLASTAKYRFPDVYIYYQDLCKNKKLSSGNPCLYKRESSIFINLYDEYSGLTSNESSSQTWFLLFPTKDHWKNKSTIEGIEKGLNWLLKNYKASGIKSLALPALGCGKGGLDWVDIGPLMCKYLIQMDIPISIYLPTEKAIPDDQLDETFLIQF